MPAVSFEIQYAGDDSSLKLFLNGSLSLSGLKDKLNGKAESTREVVFFCDDDGNELPDSETLQSVRERFKVIIANWQPRTKGPDPPAIQQNPPPPPPVQIKLEETKSEQNEVKLSDTVDKSQATKAEKAEEPNDTEVAQDAPPVDGSEDEPFEHDFDVPDMNGDECWSEEEDTEHSKERNAATFNDTAKPTFSSGLGEDHLEVEDMDLEEKPQELLGAQLHSMRPSFCGFQATTAGGSGESPLGPATKAHHDQKVVEISRFVNRTVPQSLRSKAHALFNLRRAPRDRLAAYCHVFGIPNPVPEISRTETKVTFTDHTMCTRVCVGDTEDQAMAMLCSSIFAKYSEDELKDAMADQFSVTSKGPLSAGVPSVLRPFVVPVLLLCPAQHLSLAKDVVCPHTAPQKRFESYCKLFRIRIPRFRFSEDNRKATVQFTDHAKHVHSAEAQGPDRPKTTARMYTNLCQSLFAMHSVPQLAEHLKEQLAAGQSQSDVPNQSQKRPTPATMSAAADSHTEEPPLKRQRGSRGKVAGGSVTQSTSDQRADGHTAPSLMMPPLVAPKAKVAVDPFSPQGLLEQYCASASLITQKLQNSINVTRQPDGSACASITLATPSLRSCTAVGIGANSSEALQMACSNALVQLFRSSVPQVVLSALSRLQSQVAGIAVLSNPTEMPTAKFDAYKQMFGLMHSQSMPMQSSNGVVVEFVDHRGEKHVLAKPSALAPTQDQIAKFFLSRVFPSLTPGAVAQEVAKLNTDLS